MSLPEYPTKPRFVRPAMPLKVIYTVIAVVCLLIGLLGLIIPVIPGILFLIGAVMLFSKVSHRVHTWSEQQRWFQGAKVRMIEMGGLRPMQKIQYAALLTVKSTVDVLQRISQKLRRFQS